MDHTLVPSGAAVPPSRLSPTVADVRDQLERILSSASLRLTARRRDLLRFLVEETLEGRADRLKGFTVATAVFGRDGSFDPSSDPVVRLEARRLRSDLDSYYVDAGSHDPVRITIPKGGYVPHFEWQWRPPSPEEHSSPPEGPAAAGPAPPPVRVVGGRRGRALWAALVVAALLVAAAAWALRDRLVPVEEARGPSLIVLPFATLSDDEDDRLLATGMTREVIAQLMRFPDVRLFSTPASFAENPESDPRELGRRLGTAYVVQGSIQSEDYLVHVRVMLTDAETGEVLWNGTYDRPLSPGDIYTVQEEISSEIATALGQPYGVLTGNEIARAAAPSMSSYGCVLKAYVYRRTFDEGEFGPTLACLEAAVARDPDYADAWAMLGWLHLDAGRYDIEPDRDRAYRLALESASRANAIDPDNVLALKALGSIYHYTDRFDESVAAMRRALALNPNDPDAMAQLGWRLAARGNFAEGIPYLQRAIDRTLSPPGWYFEFIAIDDYLKGDYAAMLTDAERSGADGSAMALSFIAVAQGALGRQADAKATLDKLAEVWPAFIEDPEAAYRVHKPTEELLQTMLAGLRKAGWQPPAAGEGREDR